MNIEENKADTTASRPPSLTDLHLGNFKAFAETQHLPIKPLTLIFGANSSGKSSIIHGLLLANHALANGNVDVHQPRLAGQSVDLGGFHEFVHQHEVERGCTLGFALRHDFHVFQSWFGAFRRTTLVFEIGRANYPESGRERSGSVVVRSFAVKIDDHDFVRAAHRNDGSLRVDSINFEHPYLDPFFKQVNRVRPPESKFRQSRGSGQSNNSVPRLMETANPGAAQFSADLNDAEDPLRDLIEEDVKIRADFFGQLKAELGKFVREIAVRPGNLVPVSARSKGDREQFLEGAEFENIWRRLEKLDNFEFFEEVGNIFCFEIEDLLDWINEEFSRCLESLTYLGPLRCYPPRHLVGMHDQDPNWFSGGGHAWDVLRRDPNMAKRVNTLLASSKWQSANYELMVRHLKDLGRVDEAEKQRLADRLKQLGADSEANALAAVDAILADLAGDQTSTAFGEVTLVDKRTGLEVSHRDVGVGISQVLPVLVHAYADQNQLVAIEQPEIHLHPALQAELGDVFIESALGERKNTLLLETHSEHLILRILRRVRETTEGNLAPGATPIRPEDVSVVFVEPSPEGSKVRHLPVTPDGDFAVPWPGGFFADRFKDLP